MSDKPGCVSFGDLQELRQTVHKTGRIWSVDFSERFEVPAVTLASQLVLDGAIGDVIHTLGIGPHRLNANSRPNWFFDPKTHMDRRMCKPSDAALISMTTISPTTYDFPTLSSSDEKHA